MQTYLLAAIQVWQRRHQKQVDQCKLYNLCMTAFRTLIVQLYDATPEGIKAVWPLMDIASHTRLCDKCCLLNLSIMLHRLLSSKFKQLACSFWFTQTWLFEKVTALVDIVYYLLTGAVGVITGEQQVYLFVFVVLRYCKFTIYLTVVFKFSTSQSSTS